MKLDAQVLRYLTRDDFRVLTAIEMGMKNHELVPSTLICSIAGLTQGPGAAFKIINTLHRNKLIYHENKSYDGYRLTYLGYDYLALRTYVARGLISGLGRRIGVGKEADIYECCNEAGETLVLKIHRLGRISFRQIKNKRDYLLHRKNASWMYMSRLAAIREFTYMKALYDHGFPVPVPYDQSRHSILMSHIDAYPFGQIREISNTGKVYSELLNLIIKLAEHGLIHADFNEFNLLINDDEKITLIDFPQMVSTNHPEARQFFERDVGCITRYFTKRFGYLAGDFPRFERDIDESKRIDLDKELEASGHAGMLSFLGTQEQRREYERQLMGKTDAAAAKEAEEAGEADEDEEEEEESEDELTEEQLAESLGINADDLAESSSMTSGVEDAAETARLKKELDGEFEREETRASVGKAKRASKKKVVEAAAADEDDDAEESEDEEAAAARKARMQRKDARQQALAASQALKAARKAQEKEKKRREREGLPPLEPTVQASASSSSSTATVEGAEEDSKSNDEEEDDVDPNDDDFDTRSIASSAAAMSLQQLGLRSNGNVLNIQLPKVKVQLKKTNRNKNRELKKIHASIREHL